MTEKELMHFGIPGMRWGTRKGGTKPAPKSTKKKKKGSALDRIKKALSDYGDEPSSKNLSDSIAERRLRKKDPSSARKLRVINATKGSKVVRDLQLKRLAKSNPSAARAQRIRDALK